MLLNPTWCKYLYKTSGFFFSGLTYPFNEEHHQGLLIDCCPDCLIDSKVIAEDFDGPSFDHVRYSIVDGNQGSPFTIDPVRGELKVARQLDRERVRETADTMLTVHIEFNPLSN